MIPASRLGETLEEEEDDSHVVLPRFILERSLHARALREKKSQWIDENWFIKEWMICFRETGLMKSDVHCQWRERLRD